MKKPAKPSRPATRAAGRRAKDAPAARPVAPPTRKSSAPPGVHPEIVLLAVTGMSPAVITETVWALAHPAAGGGEEPVLPHRVVVLTTAVGRREVESQLFTPRPGFGGVAVWDALRAALAAEGFDLTGRLRFGTTPDDIRVFTTSDPGIGRTIELDDMRTPADNEAAASFILEQVRGFVEDPDKVVIASLAGGRKTKSALLYACFSLLGRDTDRLTHVLVSEPFDQLREFNFPAQPGGPLKHRDGTAHDPAGARIEIADVPFVPLRYLFPRELGRPAGGFMRLVESCRAGVRARVAEGLRLTVERSRPEIEINGSRLRLAPREHLVILFLAERAKNGEPTLALQKDSLDPLNEFRVHLLGEAPKGDWSDWRRADSLKTPMEEQDLRRALSSLREKIQSLGGDAAALATCLPERGRFSLDVPAELIFLKPGKQSTRIIPQLLRPPTACAHPFPHGCAAASLTGRACHDRWCSRWMTNPSCSRSIR
jgi:CRISPR-associated protein (TIGR02584 family)